MMKRLLMIFLAFFFLSPAWYAGATEASQAKKANPDRDQPINITSDRLEAYNEKRLVVFSGNAVAVQGDKVIKADSLLIHYKKEPGETREKTESGDFARTGSVEKIEARGNVRITQEKKIVTGDYAVYYQDSQKIVMTGNAVMKEGNNTLRGEKIDVFLDENRGVVESSGNQRVTATIYPAGKKETK